MRRSQDGPERAGPPGSAAEPAAVCAQRIEQRSACVAVIGLGYVGLPLAMAFCAAGFPVLGVDVDPAKVTALEAGESYIDSVAADRIGAFVADRRFAATTDFARLREADAILICVPTPLDRHRQPDLGYVTRTAEAIAPQLRRGHLVCLESTTYPGTTGEVLRPILESGGLMAGEDFFLAYSPEREDPGNASFDTGSIPKVVGADDAMSLDLARSLYAAAVDRVVAVSSARTAEAVKITENIYRAVNIALVNELKVIYEAMDIDVWEVIDAAATKPFGFTPFYPGPGLGGHCIPIDPFYLAWKAREYGMNTRFIELAGEINRLMPGRVVARLVEALGERLGKPLNGARVLVIGVAYKKNVADLRESPALEVMEALTDRGAVAAFYDPLIAEIPPTRDHARLAGRRRIDFERAELASFDAGILITDHDGLDLSLLADALPLIVDTRNAMERAGIDSAKVVKA